MYLYRYLVEDVVSMKTVARGRLCLLEGVAAEEFDIVVGVMFISCNGSTTVAFAMYCTF